MADNAIRFVPIEPGLLIHPKPRRVAALLQIRRSEARLLCENLWLFAVQICPLGIFNRQTAIEGAEFAIDHVDTWITRPTAEAALSAFIESEVIDRNESNEFSLHGWGEHAGRARPMSNAERQANYRRKHPKSNATSNDNSNANIIAKVTKSNDDVTEASNGQVTKSNGQVKLSEVNLTELNQRNTVIPQIGLTLEPAPDAPGSTTRPNLQSNPLKARKRRGAKPVTPMPPELVNLCERWRKPVNRKSVAELWELRISEGATAAEILAGANAYLASRLREDPKFDKMLETFLGPSLHFKTKWVTPTAAEVTDAARAEAQARIAAQNARQDAQALTFLEQKSLDEWHGEARRAELAKPAGERNPNFQAELAMEYARRKAEILGKRKGGAA